MGGLVAGRVGIFVVAGSRRRYCSRRYAASRGAAFRRFKDADGLVAA
jgi:hypothetical protein